MWGGWRECGAARRRVLVARDISQIEVAIAGPVRYSILMAITQTTQISLSDEALHTAVWGSGASSYEWYESFDFSEDSLTITLVMETDDGGSERATLSVDALRRAIVSIHEEMSSCVVCSVEWTDPECDSEVDADIADCIMQWCVLGDIVWG